MTGVCRCDITRRLFVPQIMSFTAFSVVSMVVAVVSIQLLRVGLVNHTTDGHTFQKEKKVSTLVHVSLVLFSVT